MRVCLFTTAQVYTILFRHKFVCKFARVARTI